MYLFGDQYALGDHKESIKRFIRLSPLIHIDSNTPKELIELLGVLYGMDMNLTEDAEIAKVEECFNEWKKGMILNQTIEFAVTRGNEVISTIGHSRYVDAMGEWRRLD